MLAQCKQRRHGGSLFTPLALPNLMGGATIILPDITRRAPVKLTHEWQSSVAPWSFLQCGQHRGTRNQIENADAVDGQNCRFGISVCQSLCCVRDALAPASGCQCVLKRRRRGFDVVADFLCQCLPPIVARCLPRRCLSHLLRVFGGLLSCQV